MTFSKELYVKLFMKLLTIDICTQGPLSQVECGILSEMK